MKNHQKRLSVPRSWVIGRKVTTFITRLRPGAHTAQLGMPLSVVLKSMAGVANTTKEVKKALHNNTILVDQKKVSDHRRAVGLMDTISIPGEKKAFRMTLDHKGFIRLVKIDDKESKIKVSKIIGKTVLGKSKTQLNLSDSRNILVEKDEYKVGDSVVLDLPSQKITSHLKFETGAYILLIGGKHKGEKGKLVDIKDDTVLYERKEGKFTTLKKYAFVIGKDKSVVTL